MQIAVFDTNIIIEYSRGRKEAQDLISTTTHRLISLVTWTEFLVGIPLEEQDNVKLFLDDNFEIIDISRAVADEAILIRKNTRIKLPDALIYATARTEGLPLTTLNTRDFNPEWEDVKVPYGI